MRAALLALMSIPAWACATASYDAPPPDSLLSQSEDGGSTNVVDGGAGNSASAGKGDVAGAGGRGGSSGNSSASAGKGGVASGGTSSGGTSSGGKGGTSSAGTSSGGANSAGAGGKGGSSSAGTGAGGTSSGAGAPNGGANSAGSSSAGTSSAGTSSAGTSSGGTGASATCDAAHAVATLTTNQSYTGKATDCVRLTVNSSWSVINVQLQPLPGTQGYPLPFSFFNCGGNGTGSLTADYANVTLKSGANPGCDFFVQFGGGDTTIKVTYYD